MTSAGLSPSEALRASVHRKTILFAAVEPSADQIGASVMASLRRQRSDIRFIGCGGEAMAGQGLSSAFPIDALAVVGFFDVAAVYFKALSYAKKLAQLAAREQATAAVFIDGWAFSRLCATEFKKTSPHTRLYKLAAPQIWASRPQRIDFVKQMFDGVMTLLPFEAPLFEKHGVPTVFIGNPNFEEAVAQKADGQAFRERYELKGRPVVGLAPGSRRHEIARLTPIFIGVIQRLARDIPDLAVVAPLAPAITAQAKAIIEPALPQTIFVDPEEKYDAFAAMTTAIAASGTVTTELAITKTPMVVAYRVDPLTAIWARRVYQPQWLSIVNIVAGKEIFPECLQEDCTTDAIYREIADLMKNPMAREQQQQAAAPIVASLLPDGPPAADRAAMALLNWLE